MRLHRRPTPFVGDNSTIYKRMTDVGFLLNRGIRDRPVFNEQKRTVITMHRGFSCSMLRSTN